MNKVANTLKNKKNKFLAELSMVGTMIIAEQNRLFCIDGAISTTAEKVIETLKNVAQAVLPLMIVICGISLLVTRDERKLAMEKKLLVVLIIAYALIMLSDKIFETVSGWIGA